MREQSPRCRSGTVYKEGVTHRPDSLWILTAFLRHYSPEFGTNTFAGMGIGANGAKRSDGAGTAPDGLAPLGFKMST